MEKKTYLSHLCESLNRLESIFSDALEFEGKKTYEHVVVELSKLINWESQFWFSNTEEGIMMLLNSPMDVVPLRELEPQRCFDIALGNTLSRYMLIIGLFDEKKPDIYFDVLKNIINLTDDEMKNDLVKLIYDTINK